MTDEEHWFPFAEVPVLEYWEIGDTGQNVYEFRRYDDGTVDVLHQYEHEDSDKKTVHSQLTLPCGVASELSDKLEGYIENTSGTIEISFHHFGGTVTFNRHPSTYNNRLSFGTDIDPTVEHTRLRGDAVTTFVTFVQMTTHPKTRQDRDWKRTYNIDYPF